MPSSAMALAPFSQNSKRCRLPSGEGQAQLWQSKPSFWLTWRKVRSVFEIAHLGQRHAEGVRDGGQAGRGVRGPARPCRHGLDRRLRLLRQHRRPARWPRSSGLRRPGWPGCRRCRWSGGRGWGRSLRPAVRAYRHRACRPARGVRRPSRSNSLALGGSGASFVPREAPMPPFIGKIGGSRSGDVTWTGGRGRWRDLVGSGYSEGRILASGAVAQLGEHLLCKQGVAGSIPVRSTFRNSLTHSIASSEHGHRRQTCPLRLEEAQGARHVSRSRALSSGG